MGFLPWGGRLSVIRVAPCQLERRWIDNKRSPTDCERTTASIGRLTLYSPRPQSNGPSYSNTVIVALAVDGWAVTFGTAAAARPGPS